MPKTGRSWRLPHWPDLESRVATELRSWGSPGAFLPACPLPGSAGVYVFPAAWLGCEALKGEVTTWLQPLLKANRVLTACQAH